MPRLAIPETQPDKINVSVQLSQDLYTELAKYCHTHQMKKSEVIRQALQRELLGGRDWQILSQCEKLIDIKLESLSPVISLPAKRGEA